MSILITVPTNCFIRTNSTFCEFPTCTPSVGRSFLGLSHLQAWQRERTPRPLLRSHGVIAQASSSPQSCGELRTCRTCKQSFDSSQNHPRACRFHSAHFGGETKRKFESVYTGGTLDTAGGGEIFQYWHCCGSKDPFGAGCEAAPHRTYDDV